MVLWMANCCLLLNGWEKISQIIGQLSRTRDICRFKSYLDAIDFPHSHDWRRFWWIVHFCLERFPDDTRHTIAFWVDVFFWWGALVRPGENTDLTLVDGWTSETLLTITGVSQSQCGLLMVAAALAALVFVSTCGSSVSRHTFSLMLILSMKAYKDFPSTTDRPTARSMARQKSVTVSTIICCLKFAFVRNLLRFPREISIENVG